MHELRRPDYAGLVLHAVRSDTSTGPYDAAAAAEDVHSFPGVSVEPRHWTFQGDGTPAVVEDNPFGDGGRVLRVVTPSQGPLSDPVTSELINRPTLTGTFVLEAEHAVLNLEYDIRFGDDYHLTSPWGHLGANTEAYGGKLPGLGGTGGGGSVPVSCDAVGDTDEGFSARNMWVHDARLSSYMYWRDKTKDCGHNYAYGPRLEDGRWYTVRQRITMNTPGERDGRIERWIDGVKYHDVDRFLFREADQSFGINRLVMHFYHGGATWEWGHPGGAPGEPANSIYFRDFIIWTGS